jgi:hypothetical protein
MINAHINLLLKHTKRTATTSSSTPAAQRPTPVTAGWRKALATTLSGKRVIMMTSCAGSG